MATPPHPLLDSLAKNRCMLFVGSGLSTTAGYPGWPQLIDALVTAAVGANPKLAASLREYAADQKNPLLVAEYARSRLGPQLYGSTLRGLFSDAVRPQPVHDRIARTAYRALITTNYDKLLETAVTFARGAIPAVFSFENLPEMGTALYEDRYLVFKLHGDISSPGSVVLTSQDYDRVMFRSPYVRSFLQAIFLNFTLLFVGYSLTDPDFQMVLKELQLIFQGTTPPHYALLPDPHDFTAEHLVSQMNIRVIPYDSRKNHKEASEFLAALQKVAPYPG